MEKIRSLGRLPPKQESTPSDYINQLNIRSRVCHVFTAREKQNGDNIDENDKICECGHPKSKHKVPLDHPETGWNMQYNTFERINPANGQFENKSWFVRLAEDTPLQIVEKILLDAWKIPKPRFIVSIIGGAKFFKLNDRLETNFINGIVDIAQKADAWLLTTGYNIGIVQLVGQAINKVRLTMPKQTITAIGICKWGSVANVEYVTRSKDEETTEKTTETTNNPRRRRRSGEWELEMNHSHYLMLDDGTVHFFDTKDYRTRLAIHMARLQHENDLAVPVVTIVVEGGTDTIANVYYDLRENIPVIIIDGSGRAADFLNRWLLYTKDLEDNAEYREIVCEINEAEEIDERKSTSKKTHSFKSNSGSIPTNSTKSRVDSKITKLEKLFTGYREHLIEDMKNSISRQEDNDQLIKQIMYCLQPAVRSDINVFNLTSDSDLSETIFRSICCSRQKLTKRREYERYDEAERNRQSSKATTNKEWKKYKLKSHYPVAQKEENAARSRLLDLAMSWECIDAAKELVFQSSLDNILNKNQSFITALQKNLPTFVYEFLKLKINPSEVFFSKNGFFLQEFRYKKLIITLYTPQAVTDTSTHLKYFITKDKDVSKRIVDGVETLNLIFGTLIGDYMQELYFDTAKKEKNKRLQSGLMKPIAKLSDEGNKNRMESGLMKSTTKLLDGEERDRETEKEREREMAHDYIMRDLFLWAVLMNYTDMAKVLLAHMKYRICPALIATKIFKQYHQKATYGELKDGYMESATYFEQYAINCLDKCDDYDVNKACEIVLQRNELYGYVTCLQVAADAKDKLFLATPCCVEAMNNIWYDKLHPKQSSVQHKSLLLVGFVSLGLAAPAIISYRKTEKEITKIDPSNRRLRSNGINYSDPSLLEYSMRPASYPAYKRYFAKLIKFHQSLPVKFCYHLITYLFFLLLFSYFLLFNFNPPTDQHPSIHWTEILTIILVSCMLIEEMHYFLTQDSLTFFGKIKHYFRDVFKLLTLIAFILFYIGLIVRFTHAASEEDFTAARIIMAIDIELWWLRLLSFIIVIPFLGPHLVAIGEMLKDLFFFMCIIAVVMIGYGVASRSMVYYPKANGFTTDSGGSIDTSFDGRSVVRQIIYRVYYLLHGSVGGELGTLDKNPDAGWAIATQVLLAVHMLFVNILLTNLLIAMFSKRFDQVYEDTRNIWHSQQYLFTREYYIRAPLFPPISLIYDIYYLCRMIYFFIRGNYWDKFADSNAKVFQMIPKNRGIIREWSEFEEKFTYEYAHAEIQAPKSTSTKPTSAGDSEDKEKNEDMAKKKIDTNNTVDGLKQIQKDLIKLNTDIEEMKGQLQKKRTGVNDDATRNPR